MNAIANESAIDRRANLSYEEFAEEYLYPSKPVIITDSLNRWRALERWTPEFFKREFADMKFTINSAEYGQPGYREADNRQFRMAEFIDSVLTSSDDNPAPYFRNKVLRDVFPTLLPDIEPLPEYVLPNWLSDEYLVKRVTKTLNRGSEIEIYIGGKGAAFPVLHYDGAGTHAFLMQIYGTKRYIVYSPEQEELLYPCPDRINVSLLNSVEEPDLERFPRFAQAVPTTFTLEPGELLFVPAHWWHTARMLTPSITISVNVLNQSNWHELVSFVTHSRRNPLVALASHTYLAGAGARRAWRDRAWRKRSVQLSRRRAR